MALDVVLKKIGKLPVIAMSGRAVDIDVKKMVKRIDALYRKSFPTVILDVTNTDFIDSHGLGTVVYYHTLMQKEKRELIILNTNPNPNAYLKRLFELTHLDRVLKIVSTLPQMMNAAPRPQPVADPAKHVPPQK
jgi:anti-anti-sigma factor